MRPNFDGHSQENSETRKKLSICFLWAMSRSTRKSVALACASQSSRSTCDPPRRLKCRSTRQGQEWLVLAWGRCGESSHCHVSRRNARRLILWRGPEGQLSSTQPLAAKRERSTQRREPTHKNRTKIRCWWWTKSARYFSGPISPLNYKPGGSAYSELIIAL